MSRREFIAALFGLGCFAILIAYCWWSLGRG